MYAKAMQLLLEYMKQVGYFIVESTWSEMEEGKTAEADTANSVMLDKNQRITVQKTDGEMGKEEEKIDEGGRCNGRKISMKKEKKQCHLKDKNKNVEEQ